MPSSRHRSHSSRRSATWRSEEHTSELQSRSDLVCRLLLEKKKPKTELSRQMTNSMTSIDILCMQAGYANLHTDQEHDYFMQRYHAVISSFGGNTSSDHYNR